VRGVDARHAEEDLYRIPARPFWDHWHTAAAFAGTALGLGGLLLAGGALAFGVLTPALSGLLAAAVALGLAVEGAGLVGHARDLKNAQSEGAASFYAQVTRYGYPYWLRNGLLAGALLLALGLAITGSTSAGAFALLAAISLASSLIGRALFFMLVIPTTMPGAFFWKNAGFIEHAREIGLADMPQLGVVREHHHPFRLGELIETLRTTSLKDKLVQVRRILTG
jgi:DMSO reductase anchor subunit